MKKIIIGLSLLAGLVLAPTMVSAATIEELQAQINALTLQISRLKNTSATSAVVPSKTPPTVTAQWGDYDPENPSLACINLQYNLRYRGTDTQTNGEVSMFQDFLQSKGYLNNEPTGFFGLLTMAAAKKYQASVGLSPTGYVGPLTRGKIKDATCGGTVSTTFSALPISGNVPLLVSFSTTASTDNGELIIDFGDGQHSSFEKGLTHYYTTVGTYIATLAQQPPFVCNAPAGTVCAQVMPSQVVIGKVKINVTDSNPNSGAPVVKGIEGPASLNVGQTGTWTVHASVPDQLGAQLSYSVQWGDEGLVAVPTASSPVQQTLQTSATFTHVYQNNGTYKLTFTVSNSAGSAQTSMSVVVGGQASTGITVTAPNGGGYWYRGNIELVQWTTSNIPEYNQMLIRLRSVDTKQEYNLVTTNNDGNEKMFIPSSIPIGAYNLEVKTSVGTQSYVDSSDSYFKVIDGTATTPNITVTAPNGGEQWEIGVLNTITWTPYGYNPDINPPADVVAWLDQKLSNGGVKTVGKIVPSGKASIHWEGQIDTGNNVGVYPMPEPGQYYIRVENTKTGATDTSNAPFTLLPRSVDLKVNGSDGPITVASNQKVTVSWKGTGVKYCALYNVQRTIGGTEGNVANLPPSGTLDLYFAPPSGASNNVWITCERPDGTTRGDAVGVNTVVPISATLKITSPNGGEQIPLTQPYTIRWTQKGLTNPIAIALYRNDQWYNWIDKNVSRDKSAYDSYEYSWTPRAGLIDSQVFTEPGNVFKIYITGQKADGSGYVDDKSDAPFGFSVGSTSCTAPHIASNILVTTGSSPNQQWGQNLSADQAVTWSSPNLPPWGTLSGNKINFTAPPYTGTYSYMLVATNNCGAIDRQTMNIIISNGSAALDQSSMTSTSGTPTISGTANVSAVGVVISNSGGKVYGSGLVGNNGGRWSVTVSPPLPSGTYTVIVNNYFSNVALAKGSLTVTTQTTTPAPTLTFTASPTTITTDQTFLMSWSSSNATTCTDPNGTKGGSSGYVSTSGSTQGSIGTPGTYPYSMTCTGAGGSVTKSVTITVSPSTARLTCGLYRGGTNTATNMIASPNPATSVEDTDSACINYCDASGPISNDKCLRGTNTIKTYQSPDPTSALNSQQLNNLASVLTAMQKIVDSL